jgi:hypothetical protein
MAHFILAPCGAAAYPPRRHALQPLLQGNHIFTSGATGTNAAVIRGALRAERAELLTVVLPQSMSRQPQESQELLSQVEHVIEMPQNDKLQLLEASRCVSCRTCWCLWVGRRGRLAAEFPWPSREAATTIA